MPKWPKRCSKVLIMVEKVCFMVKRDIVVIKKMCTFASQNEEN